MQSKSVLYFRLMLAMYLVVVGMLCAFGGNLQNPLLYLVVITTLTAIALPVRVVAMFLASAVICIIALAFSIAKSLIEGAVASVLALLVISQRADMLLLRSENKNVE